MLLFRRIIPTYFESS